MDIIEEYRAAMITKIAGMLMDAYKGHGFTRDQAEERYYSQVVDLLSTDKAKEDAVLVFETMWELSE